jgi:hypothetical protein
MGGVRELSLPHCYRVAEVEASAGPFPPTKLINHPTRQHLV